MSSIIKKLEAQRRGLSFFKDSSYSFKYLHCLREDTEYRESPLFMCKFCRVPGYTDLVAIAHEDGLVEFKNTDTRTQGRIATHQGHRNAVFEVSWFNTTPNLISGAGDHNATLWDCSQGDIRFVSNFRGHNRSVKVISIHPTEDDIFLTGSRDCSIVVWDKRTKSAVNRIFQLPFMDSGLTNSGKKNPGGSESVTSAVFINDYTIVSSSAGYGALRVWDIRRSYMSMRRQTPPKMLITPSDCMSHGFTCLVPSPCGNYLYANCINNKLYRFNIGVLSDKPTCQVYYGHKVSSFYIRHCLSPDGKYLASGSDDSKAYIWSIDRPGTPLCTLEGHTAEVTAIDWAACNQTKLATCSDDRTYMVWSVKPYDPSVYDESGDTCLRGTNRMLGPPPVRSPRAMSTCWLKCKKVPVSLKSPVKSSPSKLVVSPRKSPQQVSKRVKFSPQTCGEDDLSLEQMGSPTAGLPNYVEDGLSPHSHVCTKRQAPKSPWAAFFHRATPSPDQPRRARPTRRTPAKTNLLRYFTSNTTRKSRQKVLAQILPSNENESSTQSS